MRRQYAWLLLVVCRQLENLWQTILLRHYCAPLPMIGRVEMHLKLLKVSV